MIEELAKKRHPLQSRFVDPNYAVLAANPFLLEDQFFESGIKNTTFNPTMGVSKLETFEISNESGA